ncbi:hypothetical protein [Streptococcus pacificus]|uniref:Uncharacterized protein n=1 Tax=Streptococcus pacificus TaxID=2740577 RepID=A0ABS0ZHD1_9STRE|nr:hypothetical protein [Streptococcus pacificus]MBJ8325405.1 hypothetical protein [Streptococcus pacificus]
MKNSKIVNLIKNFSYIITSNFLNLFVSTLVILVLPKVIGVASYGYWQLYTFYLTYIGFFHFGWCDGIYLKFGGKNYNDLNKQYFFSQFFQFSSFQLILSILVLLYSIFVIQNFEEKYIMIAISVNFLITNIRQFFIFLLQTTNQIKQSSLIMISDRAIYVVMIVILLFSGKTSFYLMILLDNIARFISLLYSSYICKDIVFFPIKKLYINIRESIDNILIGINLMFSNIASSLIIGIIRFTIQRNWSIETFGKVSLTLSISNLMMTFINAIGIVIFPILKRSKSSNLPIIYKSLRNILMLSMLFVLILYFPLKIILTYWLPNYSESLVFMGIIFPMTVFESKTSLLINTYLKALRMEKVIFKVNVFTMLLSLVITLFTAFYFKNLIIVVLTIIILLAFRSILSEIILAKHLDVAVNKDILLELLLSFVFILSNFLFSTMHSFIIFVSFYLLYIFIKKSDLSNTFKNFKQLIKS